MLRTDWIYNGNDSNMHELIIAMSNAHIELFKTDRFRVLILGFWKHYENKILLIGFLPWTIQSLLTLYYLSFFLHYEETGLNPPEWRGVLCCGTSAGGVRAWLMWRVLVAVSCSEAHACRGVLAPSGGQAIICMLHRSLAPWILHRWLPVGQAMIRNRTLTNLNLTGNDKMLQACISAPNLPPSHSLL